MPDALLSSAFPLASEVPIRTLSVSLVAIAAIVASVAVARHRHEDRRVEPQPTPERFPAAINLDLDGIRAAGF